MFGEGWGAERYVRCGLPDHVVRTFCATPEVSIDGADDLAQHLAFVAPALGFPVQPQARRAERCEEPERCKCPRRAGALSRRMSGHRRYCQTAHREGPAERWRLALLPRTRESV